MSRVRNTVSYYPTGTATRFGGTAYSYLVPSIKSGCTDEVLPGDNYPLDIFHEERVGGVLHSYRDGGYWQATFVNYPVDGLVNGQLGLQEYFVEEKPLAYYATQAVARTNPSRPYVDVPVAVLELADITLLLKKTGDTLIEKLASNNLKYQFGIKPLVSDLVKLTEFHDQVARRVREINKLKSARGLRRTVTLDDMAKVEPMNVVWQSSDAYIDTPTIRHTKKTIKAHTRWLPDVDLSKMADTTLTALAKRSVTGMTLDFSTLWEAMPWSWLIDWGVNIGTFLQAQRNIIPATCQGVSIIRHTVSNIPVPEVEYWGLHKMSGGHVRFERKQRIPHAPVVPTAHFPFLSGNQMGIIASLAVTRR